jgi:hypothetical protein
MLPRLLIDDRFQSQIIEHHVSDPVVRAFWLNEYAGYSASPDAPAFLVLGSLGAMSILLGTKKTRRTAIHPNR